jgi:integrase
VSLIFSGGRAAAGPAVLPCYERCTGLALEVEEETEDQLAGKDWTAVIRQKFGLITVCIIPTLRTDRSSRGLIHMAKSVRNQAPSTIVNRTVPRRAPNTELRPREYLTEREIERLQEAARKRSRYGHRDATMILIAYRHGLRASEVCGLRWDQIDLNSGRLHVRRAKGGIDNVHPLSGKEIRALRQLRRENMETRYVFITERDGPTTTAGFLKMIARTGEAAKLPFPVHPHMLRHSTGYKLANDGHDTRALQHYMGHKNIMHTVRYTEMAPDRFKNFWKD